MNDLSDPPARTRLTTGPGPLTWISFALMCLVGLPLFLLMTAIAFVLFDPMPLVAVLSSATGLLGLYALYDFGSRAYRKRYWLEGTVLIQRRLHGSRRCDLSKARVTIESLSPSGIPVPLPRLTAVEPGGRPIRLWLRDPDRRQILLPPDELRALAAAISHERPGVEQVRSVAERLRRMADGPFDIA
ncbi:hypothetical protein [Thermomonospora catenispora]|uniref:hypothetical protein n=1 Tax=Thermomonospora catenispora TaxID=2493090 RepID=UPI00111F0F0D|nr:hypothetical protein [Thermomonospora catenispora]TNY35095.1 hypothetical protein EIO00_20185 [Thermomonospora catenispora]